MPRSRFPIYESSLSGAEVCADQLNARKSLALKRNWVNDILSPIMVKEQTESPFTRNVRKVIRSIPKGRVASYAQVAALAGNHRAVRGVVWILHSSSEASGLPWHRVISSRGTISLPRGHGFEEQRKRLIAEGVDVSRTGRVDSSVSVGKREKEGAPPSPAPPPSSSRNSSSRTDPFNRRERPPKFGLPTVFLRFLATSRIMAWPDYIQRVSGPLI